MTQNVDMKIRGGLPYVRRYRIVGAKTVWPDLTQMHVRAEVRWARDESSALLFDLSDYFTSVHEGEDIIVTLTMTGSTTRSLPSGFYDIIVSDVGPTDARAICISEGRIEISSSVTSAGA